jgi:hypothetical protein
MENKAKEIFNKYSGSKFQMMRDGVLTEYDKYEITIETEKTWLSELISKEFNQLDINSIDTFFPLWYIIQHHALTNHFDRISDFIISNSKNEESINGAELFIDKVLNVLGNWNTDTKEKLDFVLKETRRFKKLRENIE